MKAAAIGAQPEDNGVAQSLRDSQEVME